MDEEIPLKILWQLLHRLYLLRKCLRNKDRWRQSIIALSGTALWC